MTGGAGVTARLPGASCGHGYRPRVAASRRRRRSVRTTVAVGLLGGAAVVVALAHGTGRQAAPAAVVALVAGIAATRIVSTEVVRSRRDAARDRADLARAYQRIGARRAREQAVLLAATAAGAADRLAEREQVVAGLRRSLRQAQHRLETAELRLALAEPVVDPVEPVGWGPGAAGRGHRIRGVPGATGSR